MYRVSNNCTSLSEQNSVHKARVYYQDFVCRLQKQEGNIRARLCTSLIVLLLLIRVCLHLFIIVDDNVAISNAFGVQAWSNVQLLMNGVCIER